MEELFLKLVNMSITASYLVLAILILRLLLRKAPRWIHVTLWGLVGLRLVFPFSIESMLSLIPSTEPLPQEFLYAATPHIQTGIPYVNNMLNPVIAQSLAPAELTSANPTQIWSFIFSQIWLLGVVLLALYALISFLVIRRRVRPSIRVGGRLYLCDTIDTPFILSILKPRIYLPSELDQATADHVVAHENAHLKRRDHWWKPLGFLLLTVYWFNPVIWLAYVLLCRDIEAACDEKVIRDMDPAYKKAYSEALLQCSVPRRLIAACPLAFGEVDVKARIKSVLNYKKPAFWVIVIALLLCAVFAVGFLTDPVGVPFADIIPGRSGEVLSITVIHGQEQHEISTASGIEYVEGLLREIMVGKTEVSKSRSEDRDKYNTLILHHENHDTFYHFSQSCSEVWYNNTVKPTMTYTVKNSEIFLQFFESGIQAPAESAGWEDACRKVLEDIQSRDSYHITENVLIDGEVISNDSAYGHFFKSGDTLLFMSQMPDVGFISGYMDDGKNGIRKIYESKINIGTLEWIPAEDVSEAVLTPWLYDFQWEDSKVDAIAMQDMGETCFIRLKVFEPVEDALLSVDSYYVDFYFDSAGNFLYAVQTVQGNILENGVDKSHTITSTMTVYDTPEVEIRSRMDRIAQGGTITDIFSALGSNAQLHCSASSNLDLAIQEAVFQQIIRDNPDVYGGVYFEDHVILSHLVGCGKENADLSMPCGFTKVEIIAYVIAFDALPADSDHPTEVHFQPVSAVLSFDEYADGSFVLTHYADKPAQDILDDYYELTDETPMTESEYINTLQKSIYELKESVTISE